MVVNKIPIVPLKARIMPIYFNTDIFSLKRNLENTTVKAPLIPVIGEAMEAGE